MCTYKWAITNPCCGEELPELSVSSNYDLPEVGKWRVGILNYTEYDSVTFEYKKTFESSYTLETKTVSGWDGIFDFDFDLTWNWDVRIQGIKGAETTSYASDTYAPNFFTNISSPFIEDTFTDTDGTSITSHTPETGTYDAASSGVIRNNAFEADGEAATEETAKTYVVQAALVSGQPILALGILQDSPNDEWIGNTATTRLRAVVSGGTFSVESINGGPFDDVDSSISGLIDLVQATVGATSLNLKVYEHKTFGSGGTAGSVSIAHTVTKTGTTYLSCRLASIFAGDLTHWKAG